MGASDDRWATGVLAGVVTPFDDVFRVDVDALREHVAWLADSGVASIVVNADTGEGQHLTRQERLRIIQVTVREVGHEVPVLSGLIANFTAEAAEMARQAETAGAAGLQVFPPPAFLGSDLDPGLAAGYFEAIADATRLPLVVYRPPLEFGYGMSDEVLARILAIDAVHGFKESSFDEETYRRSLSLARRFDGVRFLSGADTFVPRSLDIGADGLALALAAVAPRRYVDLLARARIGGIDAALEASRALDPLPAVIFAKPFRDFRGRLKESLRQMGLLRSATVRPPLAPLSPREIDEITRMLAICDLRSLA
jgi:4-hydroxy-tetrahydrodipicolinate synthase